MGELFSRITVEHIQEIVQLSAGGHSMRTDIFEIKLPVEKFFNQECLSDTPPAVDYDQLRSVRVQASFQFRVFFVDAKLRNWNCPSKFYNHLFDIIYEILRCKFRYKVL